VHPMRTTKTIPNDVADFLVIGDDKKGANLFKVLPSSLIALLSSLRD